MPKIVDALLDLPRSEDWNALSADARRERWRKIFDQFRREAPAELGDSLGSDLATDPRFFELLDEEGRQWLFDEALTIRTSMRERARWTAIPFFPPCPPIDLPASPLPPSPKIVHRKTPPKPRVSSWLSRLKGTGVSFGRLEAMVESIVEDHFADRRPPEKRRDPAFGRSTYTVFNLEKPITRWLRELRAGRVPAKRRKESLRGYIRRYLRRAPVVSAERVP